MKTKIIPFDLETAKKIQAGEIEGKIKTRKGASVRVVAWDMKCRDNAPILALIDCGYDEEAIAVDVYGKEKVGPTESMFDLVIEIPDNEPQFKPFDKVLVRGGRSTAIQERNIWVPAYYQYHDLPRFEGDDETYFASGLYWRECIPYEGNEHLVGTTNKPE